LRRLAAGLVRLATAARTAPATVLWFATAHAVLWTVILVAQKAAQDVHMDVAEAFGWGQRFLLGYGKHPPLSGWVAGVWFTAFPARDWSAYGLAMATLGVSLVICWLIARRVVDARRAAMTVLMLAIYPIFNFKGFKYNADLLQLVTLPLIVLAYLNAFEKRTALSGVLLGLAGVAGMMTKYWAATVIGAVGIAALADPARLTLLRSPAPWVAVAIFLVGMVPHLVWLVRVDFAPLVYAGDVYELPSRLDGMEFALHYLGHNVALLLAPLIALLLALRWRPLRRVLLDSPLETLRRAVLWRPGGRSVDLGMARNIWIIQAAIALLPPLGAAAFGIYIKTDWGIPLFFLVPVAVLAAPALGVQRIALVRLVVIWLALTLVTLTISPWLAEISVKPVPEVGSMGNPTSQFAPRLTEVWHQRFHSRWAVVAGTTEVSALMTFYSPDHPATFTPGEVWSSGLTSFAEAKRLGFIGICDTTDNRLPECERWMAQNAPGAERLDMSARRFFRGEAGPQMLWKIYLVAPAGAPR
jgi:4-amino-4-deoxy-L-arabinose transferase-like glycosyltransferase